MQLPTLRIFLLLISFIFSTYAIAEHNLFYDIDDDWTLSINKEERWNTYLENKSNKHTYCDNVAIYLKQGNYDYIFFAIQDAGLFADKDCDKKISPIEAELRKHDGINISIEFYYHMTTGNSELIDLYHKYKGDSSNTYLLLKMFGFIDKWGPTWTALVYAAEKDAGTETIVCNSIEWRRFLYGEKKFQSNMKKYSNKPEIAELLDYYNSNCKR